MARLHDVCVCTWPLNLIGQQDQPGPSSQARPCWNWYPVSLEVVPLVLTRVPLIVPALPPWPKMHTSVQMSTIVLSLLLPCFSEVLDKEEMLKGESIFLSLQHVPLHRRWDALQSRLGSCCCHPVGAAPPQWCATWWWIKKRRLKTKKQDWGVKWRHFPSCSSIPEEGEWRLCPEGGTGSPSLPALLSLPTRPGPSQAATAAPAESCLANLGTQPSWRLSVL